MDTYHEHPLVNGFICLTLLGLSLVLDFVGITVANFDVVLGMIVKLAQISLGIIGVVNFYWALKKRRK
jgi:nitrogen fixation-related uncharacterized protein